MCVLKQIHLYIHTKKLKSNQTSKRPLRQNKTNQNKKKGGGKYIKIHGVNFVLVNYSWTWSLPWLWLIFPVILH